MLELKRLLFSFYYAMRGVFYSVITQRNLRIHLLAVLVVAVFGNLAKLSITHWCVVLLCCMAVISLELVNTALEALCDHVSKEDHPLIQTAKDAAAGAVLVSAIGSVVVAALLLFGNTPYSENIRKAFDGHPFLKYALLIGAAAGAAFVFIPSVLQRRK